MGLILRSNHPKALWPGVFAWWGRTYNEHTEQFSQIFDVESSSRAFDEDVQVTGFGYAAVKDEGASTVFSSETQGYVSRYTSVTYSLGYIVTQEEIEDNLYEVVSKRRAASLAFSFRQTKEVVHALILDRAFNASYLGGDSKELCATDHSTLAGSQSNELYPGADLSETAIEDMVVQIYGATNDKGLAISLQPQSLVITRQNWFEANRILKSVLQNDTANNADNVLRSMNVFPKGIVMNTYLSNSDDWFIKTNCPRGLISKQRIPLGGPIQDNDFDTDNAKVKCRERYIPFWTDWRTMFGSIGA